MRRRDDLIADLQAARDLPDSDERTTRLAAVVVGADELGDVRLGFDARLDLVDAFGRQVETGRMLDAVGWCLAAHDREPDRFDAADTELLRWCHRWAVTRTCDTPRVDLARIRSTLDDLERRHLAAGQHPRVVCALRCRLADHVGDEAGAREWLARWRAAADTGDCADCDRCSQARLLAGWGSWAEAVRTVGEPAPGAAASCTDQPERGLVAVLLPLLRLGRHDEAARAHVESYRRHRYERPAFPHLADHLRFCALARQHRHGLEILARHLGWLDRPADEMSAMEFAAAGALVCRLAAEAGLAGLAVPRPGYADRAAAEVTVAVLGAELAGTARNMALRFDARNGTAHQSRRITSWLTERPVATRIPIPADDAPPAEAPDEALVETGDGALVEALVEATDPAADEAPDDWATTADRLVPLGLRTITAVLDERGDRYVIDGDGAVCGRWGDALIRFELLGERDEILHARIVSGRRLAADRLTEAYRFCNAWNHDRLLPKAYVHDPVDGELLIAGDVSTDLEHGATFGQLAVLVAATVATGATFTAAVADLP